MNFAIFRGIQDFVGFGEEDTRRLGTLLEWLRPRLDDLAERFYGVILRHPEARRVFRDEAQVTRLKETLKVWAVKCCTGPLDEEYLRLRLRIGRVHVQVGLPQRYMLTGMSVIRQFLLEVVEENAASSGQEREIKLSIDRILDLELAVMLWAYHDDLHGRLLRNERLAALGSLALTVSHELKNPLAVLRTSVDSLRRHLARPGKPAEDRVKTHLDKLDRNLTRMVLNISSLLEFARSSEVRLEEEDVHEVIEEALEEVPRPEGVSLERRYDRTLPPLHLDPVQMARVFVNLASNAYEAMGTSGVLRVETQAAPGGVLVVFADSGPGVPPDLREQVFQPLWTGKPGGTGMGLAICRKLVEAHRGRIWVEGDPGARFHVLLPRQGESVETSPHGPDAPPG